LAGNSAGLAALTGTTTPTTQVTLAIPGGLLGPNGELEVEIRGDANSFASTFLLNVAYGGTNLSNNGPSGISNMGTRVRISNRNVQNSQIGIVTNSLDIASVAGIQNMTAAIDSTVNQNLTISMTLGNVGCSWTLQSWAVFFNSRS
jgi:hypothetical protein